MAIYRILTYPDPFLRQPARTVENIDDSLQRIIDDMGETMYAAPGAGLAAVQVGLDMRLLVYDISTESDRRDLRVLINPEIISSEGEILSENEGCLSVPDFRANVRRAAQVLVEGLDRHGNPVSLEAEGYHAVVLQHEIDHLNGKLFIDRISALKRELFKRRIKKALKEK